MESQKTDIVVIGAGPVGLFTVFQCGMLDMKCHVVDSLPEIGGQCTALYPEKPIYDIPSRPMVTGGDLIESLQEQAKPFEPVYHLDQQVVEVEKNNDVWTIKTSKDTMIECKAIIIAAGAGAFAPNRPPLQNLDHYEDNSVFYMVRDTSKFKNQNIMIAGGGDSAVDWAISLLDIAKKITVIHRRDKFRAMPESVAQMKTLAEQYPDKIEILTPYQLHELHGENGQLDSITLQHTNGEKRTVPTDSLLAFYGLVPQLGPIATWNLDLDGNTIAVDQSTCETSIPSIYAVGDIASYSKKLKLILTGFSEVASAAHHAHQYVHPDTALHFQYSTSKGVG